MSTSTALPIPGATLPSGREAAEIMRRIQATFEEMPGLRLTSTQAARLLGIAIHHCEFLLGGLVVTGFLRATRAGYVRT